MESATSALKCSDILGEDTLVNILGLLPAKSLASAACVCRSWNSAARVLNATPRMMSALSLLPDLQSAIDAVVERVMRAPFRPDFAIVFAGQKFSLSRISTLLKEKLGKNLPLIACHAAGIIGQDVASGEHMEVSWPQPGAGMSKTLSRRIVSRQNGLVLTVGRVPGLHVQALSLCNSCGVDEVESFVWQAGRTAQGEYKPQLVKQILLLGDPSADMIRVTKRLDRAFRGRSVVVGGFSALSQSEGGSLLAHCTTVSSSHLQHPPQLEEKGSRKKLPERTNSQRACKRKAPEEPPVPVVTSDSSNASTSKVTVTSASTSASSRTSSGRSHKSDGTLHQDVVALVFSDADASCKEVPRKNVDCMVGTGGGLAAIGPLYTVVSVRQTKDPLLQETTTWLTCMKEGDDKELDGNAMFEDLNNQISSKGLLAAYVGTWRPPRRHKRRVHSEDTMGSFSLYEVQGADEEYLLIGGEGVRTGDTLRFYVSDPDAARIQSQCMLNEVKRSLEEGHAPSGKIKLEEQQRQRPQPSHPMDEASGPSRRRRVFGGLLFACAGRGETYFSEANVDSNTFFGRFPDTPLTGMFCLGEIGPRSVLPCEDGSTNIHRRMSMERGRKTDLNVFSSMFVVFSHTS